MIIAKTYFNYTSELKGTRFVKNRSIVDLWLFVYHVLHLIRLVNQFEEYRKKRLIYRGLCLIFIGINIKVTHYYNVIICVEHHTNRLG